MSADKKRFETQRYGDVPIFIGLDESGVLNALNDIAQRLSDQNYTGTVYFDDTYYKGFVPERFFEMVFDGRKFLISTFKLLNDKNLKRRQDEWWSCHEEYAKMACFLMDEYMEMKAKIC